MDNFIQKLPKGDRELLEEMVEHELLAFEKRLREPSCLFESRDEVDSRRVGPTYKKEDTQKTPRNL